MEREQGEQVRGGRGTWWEHNTGRRKKRRTVVGDKGGRGEGGGLAGALDAPLLCRYLHVI